MWCSPAEATRIGVGEDRPHPTTTRQRESGRIGWDGKTRGDEAERRQTPASADRYADERSAPTDVCLLSEQSQGLDKWGPHRSPSVETRSAWATARADDR